MRPYLQLLRPYQWIKNGFVFLPLFFGRKITDPESLAQVLLLFVAFSFISGAVYVLNDLLDIQSDRQHPTKKDRPLASGRIGIKSALVWGLFVLSIGWILLCFLNQFQIHLLAAIYVSINIAYSLLLKHIPLFDIAILASGFVLRILLGGCAGEIVVSEWIVIMTFLLAVFLASSKRRSNFLLLKESQEQTEPLELYNSLLNISGAVVIVAYLMYTLTPLTQERFGSQVYMTGIFVLFGIFRYLQTTYQGTSTENPTLVLWKDPILQLIILVWISSFALLAYL